MDLEQALENFMNENGLRRTQQRKELLLSIFAREEHFTADQLMERLREENLDASRSTVYRTLALLVEAKLLKEVCLGTGQLYYDPNFTRNPGHAHLICRDCGAVEEFTNDELDRQITQLAKEKGFRDISHMVQVEGVCKKCNAKKGEEA